MNNYVEYLYKSSRLPGQGNGIGLVNPEIQTNFPVKNYTHSRKYYLGT